MNKLVSIIIPVFNGENFLEEAIDSALKQTYQNIEVLVINDGSTDNTKMIVDKYKDKVRYYEKTNGGVSSALNLGISKMKGDFFSWLSHDDMYTENKIFSQMKIIQRNPDIDVIYSKGELVDIQGENIKRRKKDKNIVKEIPPYKFYKQNVFRTPGGCSFLIKRRVFDQAGTFDENLRYNQDSDFWKRLSLYDFKIVFFDKTIVKSRIHAQQSTISLSHHYKENIKLSINNRMPLVGALNKKKHYKWLYYESFEAEDVRFRKQLYKDIKDIHKKIFLMKLPLFILGKTILVMKKTKRFFLNRHRNN